MFLGDWSEDAEFIRQNQSLDAINISLVRPEVLDEIREKSLQRVVTFMRFGGGQAVGVILGAFNLAVGCLAASSKLHSRMLWSLMKAPMRFFDATPLGRMINRLAIFARAR